MSALTHFIANFTGKVRKETLNGKQYLVAPVTLIVPGVLNGSQGKLYYPKKEVAHNIHIWNNMPLVVDHPHKANGDPTSARDPKVLNEVGIGFLFNVAIENKSGKLIGEGWFDIESTKKVDSTIYMNLQNGNSIELSTGLFLDKKRASHGATYNGKAYDYVTTNYQPDHLAILPDKKGACSVADGCGVNVENETGFVPSDVLNKTYSKLKSKTPRRHKAPRTGTKANCGIGPKGFERRNTCATGGRATPATKAMAARFKKKILKKKNKKTVDDAKRKKGLSKEEFEAAMKAKGSPPKSASKLSGKKKEAPKASPKKKSPSKHQKKTQDQLKEVRKKRSGEALKAHLARRQKSSGGDASKAQADYDKKAKAARAKTKGKTRPADGPETIKVRPQKKSGKQSDRVRLQKLGDKLGKPGSVASAKPAKPKGKPPVATKKPPVIEKKSKVKAAPPKNLSKADRAAIKKDVGNDPDKVAYESAYLSKINAGGSIQEAKKAGTQASSKGAPKSPSRTRAKAKQGKLPKKSATGKRSASKVQQEYRTLKAQIARQRAGGATQAELRRGMQALGSLSRDLNRLGAAIPKTLKATQADTKRTEAQEQRDKKKFGNLNNV